MNSDQEKETTNRSRISLEKIDAYRQLDPNQSNDFFKKIASIYLVSASQSLSEIKQAIVGNDNQALKIAAHTLKSSTANIGAETLASMCQKLEDYGQTNQIQQAQIFLPDMQHEFDQVITELEKMLVEL